MDWQQTIPFITWVMTQILKSVIPSLEHTKIGKQILPIIAVVVGVVAGAVVDQQIVNVAFPSFLQALTNAGYGLMATGIHEVGTSVGKIFGKKV